MRVSHGITTYNPARLNNKGKNSNQYEMTVHNTMYKHRLWRVHDIKKNVDLLYNLLDLLFFPYFL